MNSGNVVSAVFGTILKVAAAIAVIYLIYRGANLCYDYGYRIFTEPAVSGGEGRTVTVAVEEDMSPVEIGESFEQKGLVRDAKLFALQYLFSEYRKEVKPGVFELSTAMTAEEMMAVMASDNEPEAGNPETGTAGSGTAGEDTSGEAGSGNADDGEPGNEGAGDTDAGNGGADDGDAGNEGAGQ